MKRKKLAGQAYHRAVFYLNVPGGSHALWFSLLRQMTDHFTVVWSARRPGLWLAARMQVNCFCCVHQTFLMLDKSREVCIKARSPPDSLPFDGQVTKRTIVKWSIRNFTINAEVLALSLANFNCQFADRHIDLYFIRCVNERERTIWQFVIVKTN